MYAHHIGLMIGFLCMLAGIGVIIFSLLWLRPKALAEAQQERLRSIWSVPEKRYGLFLNCTQSAWERMEEIRRKVGAKTKKDAIMRALRLCDIMPPNALITIVDFSGKKAEFDLENL